MYHFRIHKELIFGDEVILVQVALSIELTELHCDT